MRVLLVLDAPMSTDASDGLTSVLAAYYPTTILGAEGVGVASRLSRSMDVTLEIEPSLAGGDAALQAVRAALAEHAGACLIVVASEPLARSLLCEALGVPLASAWRFQLEAGTVTVIEVGPDARWALVRLNERGDSPGRRSA